MSAALDVSTRDHLKKIGLCYGFYGSQLRISKVSNNCDYLHGKTTAVVMLCILQYIGSTDENAIHLSSNPIERLHSNISPVF